MIYDALVNADVIGACDFVANNAVKEIAINASNNNYFETGLGLKTFVFGDRISLLSIKPMFPHQYCKGTGSPVLRIEYEKVAGGAVTIPELGQDGVISYPDVEEYYLGREGKGVYLESVPITGAFYLRIKSAALNVSQVNGPAILNGDTFYINWILKISHNINIT